MFNAWRHYEVEHDVELPLKGFRRPFKSRRTNTVIDLDYEGQDRSVFDTVTVSGASSSSGPAGCFPGLGCEVSLDID